MSSPHTSPGLVPLGRVGYLTTLAGLCYDVDTGVKHMSNKEPVKQRRDCVLAVRITAGERAELAKFARERCVNVSAWVRRLLFERVREKG